MEALVLAGGLGTRMQSVDENIPKTLLNIENKPFLYWLIKHLKINNVKKIIFCLGIKHQLILNFINESNPTNIEIDYYIEQKRLGTGGALLKAMELINDKNFVFMNGDSIFDIPIKKLYYEHTINKNDLTYSLLKTNNQKTSYGGISINDKGKVLSHKMEISQSKDQLIDAGIRIINKNKLNTYKNKSGFHNQYVSFENEIAPEFIRNHKVKGNIYDLQFFDIGNPESYAYTKSNFAKMKMKLKGYNE